MASKSEVTAFARAKFAEHGLVGWSFGFDRSVQRFGVCKYNKRSITLSAKLVEANSLEQCKDTVLHEIAHALTPGAKHGPAWKAAARLIGANPERCYSASDVTVVAKYRAFCEHCGDKVLGARQQAPKGQHVCPTHKSPIVWKDARGNVVGSVAKKYTAVCDRCNEAVGQRDRRTDRQFRHTGCGGSVTWHHTALINS